MSYGIDQAGGMTPVDVYGDDGKPRSVLAKDLRCTECGATYAWDPEAGDEQLLWVLLPGLDPFIECGCGEQYYRTEDRDR